jgi:hypothetical protein
MTCLPACLRLAVAAGSALQVRVESFASDSVTDGLFVRCRHHGFEWRGYGAEIIRLGKEAAAKMN